MTTQHVTLVKGFVSKQDTNARPKWRPNPNERVDCPGGSWVAILAGGDGARNITRKGPGWGGDRLRWLWRKKSLTS